MVVCIENSKGKYKSMACLFASLPIIVLQNSVFRVVNWQIALIFFMACNSTPLHMFVLSSAETGDCSCLALLC